MTVPRAPVRGTTLCRHSNINVSFSTAEATFQHMTMLMQNAVDTYRQSTLMIGAGCNAIASGMLCAQQSLMALPWPPMPG
jgi:hypothetical protein